MLAAGLGEALDQHLVGSSQEQHIAGDARIPDLLEQFRETFQVTGQVARIDTDGHLGQAQIGVLGLAGQLGKQPGRQVVDAIVAVVFKQMKGSTLARAGAAADHHKSHGVRPKLSLTMIWYRVWASGAWRSASRYAASSSRSARVLRSCGCC